MILLRTWRLISLPTIALSVFILKNTARLIIRVFFYKRFPLSAMSCHVTRPFNIGTRLRTSIDFRFGMALNDDFDYEFDGKIFSGRTLRLHGIRLPNAECSGQTFRYELRALNS